MQEFIRKRQEVKMKRLIVWILMVTFAVGLFGCTSLKEKKKKDAMESVQDALQEAKDSAKDAWEEAKDPVMDAWDQAKDAWEEAKDPVFDTLDQVKDTVQDAWSSVKDTWGKNGVDYETVYTKATVYHDGTAKTRVRIIVQIRNTGKETLYLGSSSVDLVDESGKQIATKSYLCAYPNVLKPGETALLAEDTFLDSDPGTDELRVVPHLDIGKAKVDCIRYAISGESLTESMFGGIGMTGRIQNTSSETASAVYVVANLYDADHHGIGQIFTILADDLKPGEEVDFTLSDLFAQDSLTTDSVAFYEVFGFPMQYQS